MRRLLFALSTCAAVVACNNLHLTEGNAYPCDFSQPPGVRDAPCLGTDVCGLANVCVAYVNEGPRFEGGLTAGRLPAYARAGFVLNDAVPLHPGVLHQQVTFLATDTLRPNGKMVVGTADGLFSVAGSKLEPSVYGDAGDLQQAVLLTVNDGTTAPASLEALAGLKEGALVCRVRTANDNVIDCLPGVEAARLRSSAVPLLSTPPSVMVPLQAVTAAGQAFQVSLRTPLVAPTLQDGGLFAMPDAATDVVDVAVLNHEVLASTPVVLARDGLWLQQDDGGFEVQLQAPFGDIGALSLNFPATLLTANNAQRLSTWQVSVTGVPPRRTHTLSQAWPDCQPCRAPGGIRAVTPLPPAAGVGVEVLCRNVAGFSLVRVTGSHAAAATDACETQTLALPLDPALISDGSLLVANTQRGITFGNLHGSVWSGETLSTVQPLALERVPLDVTTIATTTDGGRTLVAITDRYLAAYDPAPPSNGFRRVSASEFNVGDDLRFVSAVRGDDGWGVLANGVVAHATLGEAGNTLDFGPRLVSPSGEAVSRSSGGEAYVSSADGGVLALFVAADDGLYALTEPVGALGDSPGGTFDVTPQLQPEPSVPIRSLALERTPLGTNGTTRARGYLVTSRNVYEWSLGGTPARWSSTLLVLGGGEPVEVWFDTQKSALGRVGYADGQIFTLPSGFQLTLPLPGDDTTPVKVLDYENFGGWPVALTTTGLWAASWGISSDGTLENHFDGGASNRPMEWHRLTLADGAQPWLPDAGTPRGKLFVGQRKVPASQCENTDAGDLRNLYTLSVFLPGEVRKLAEYCRN